MELIGSVVDHRDDNGTHAGIHSKTQVVKEPLGARTIDAQRNFPRYLGGYRLQRRADDLTSGRLSNIVVRHAVFEVEHQHIDRQAQRLPYFGSRVTGCRK